MAEQPPPIPQRYLDITFSGGASVQLTLWPEDDLEMLADRIVVTLRAKQEEVFVAFLDHIACYRESRGFYYPLPLDEHGTPVNPFRTFEEYRSYRESRGVS